MKQFIEILGEYLRDLIHRQVSDWQVIPRSFIPLLDFPTFQFWYEKLPYVYQRRRASAFEYGKGDNTILRLIE